PRPLTSAQPAMRGRKAGRWPMTNAEMFTARMPRGVITPSERSTISRSRRLMTPHFQGDGVRRLVAAAAGLRAACVVASVERVPARARVHRVRVVHREPGTHQAVDVVDL